MTSTLNHQTPSEGRLLGLIEDLACEIKALRRDIADLRAAIQSVAINRPSGTSDGPWLTMQEAGERLGYRSRNGIYEWVKATGIQRMRRGRQWLVAKRDVDAAIGATQRNRG